MKRSPSRRALRARKNRSRSLFSDKKSRLRKTSRYAKKSALLRGGSTSQDQLKYIENNFTKFTFDTAEVLGLRLLDNRISNNHVKPIYDLFLWNNKDFENTYYDCIKYYSLIVQGAYEKYNIFRNFKLDYNGDILTFKQIEAVIEDKQGTFFKYKEENQFLKFELNSNSNLAIYIPVFKTSGVDGFQIGGKCFLATWNKSYKFISPIVSGENVKYMLIDFYKTIDPKTGTTKSVLDLVERKEYLRKKVSKELQDSIDSKKKYVITKWEFDTYVSLGILNRKAFDAFQGPNFQLLFELK